MTTNKRATKRLLPALIAATLAVSAMPAQAVQFSGVYIFGDSLSDAGFYRPGLTAIVGASAASGIGRFTTNPGPVWAEVIAQFYGGNPNPSNVAGGQNFAQGGMRVNLPTPPSLLGPGGAQRPVSTQIDEHLATRSGAADPTGLYAVWAGANDLFANFGALQVGAITAAQLQANVLAAAVAEVGQIGRLRAAGARYVLVFNLPDVGGAPAFAGGPVAPTVTALSAGYNVTLFNAIAASGMRVIPVDTFTLIAEVRRNAAAFGFTNITGTACLPAGSSSLTCTAANIPSGAATNFLFADGVHPTTGGHAVIADFVKALIDGPSAYSTMAEVPLGSRASHVRTIEQGLQQGNAAELGKANFFAAGDGGRYDLAASRINPGTDSKTTSATIGVTMRATDWVTVGAAIGTSKADATLAGLGKYDLRETAWSLFASVKAGGLYGNFTLSNADLKFNNINRIIRLGAVTRTTVASTGGSNASGSLMLGYDASLGPLTVGPFAQVTMQNVAVSAFQENAGAATALSTDLKIGAQDRASQVVSVGARASVNLGAFTPFIRASFDQEQRNDERFISASPVTIAQNIFYDIPGYRGDNKWSTVTVGIRGSFAKRVGFGLSYTSVSGREGIKQDGVSGSVSVAF